MIMCEEINTPIQEQPPKKKKRGGIIAITVILSVVFICVVAASYVVFDEYLMEILEGGVTFDYSSDGPGQIPAPDGEQDKLPEDIPVPDTSDEELFAD